jgi:hypothetical protein
LWLGGAGRVWGCFVFGLFLRFCWVGFWFMLFGGRLVFSEIARREMPMVLLRKIGMVIDERLDINNAG